MRKIVHSIIKVSIIVTLCLSVPLTTKSQTSPLPKPAVRPIVQAQIGHRESVAAVAISRDNKLILSASSDAVFLWEASTGALIRRLNRAVSITSLAFSPDDRSVVGGSKIGYVFLWDVATGNVLQEFKGHAERITSVAFSSDNRRAATGSYDKSVKIWDIRAGALLKTLEGHTGPVNDLNFSPTDVDLILSGSTDSTIRLWNIRNESARVLKGHSSPVLSASFNLDGKLILSCSQDYTMRIWDALSGKETRRFNLPDDQIFTAKFIENDKKIITGSYEKSFIWDVRTGSFDQNYVWKRASINSIAVSRDNNFVVLGGSDNSPRLLYLKKKNKEIILESRAHFIDEVHLSPTKKSIVTCEAYQPYFSTPILSGEGYVWNMEKGSQVRSFEYIREVDSVWTDDCVSFSPDGELYEFDGFYRSVQSGDPLIPLEIENTISRSVISPDGQYIISVFEGKLYNRKTHVSLQLSNQDFTSFTFSPLSKYFVAWSENIDEREIRLIDSQTGMIINSLIKGHSFKAFSADGDLMITSDNAGYYVLNKAGSSLIKAYDNTEDFRDFFPKEKVILSARGLDSSERSGEIFLRDAVTGNLLKIFKNVAGYEISPEGGLLFVEVEELDKSKITYIWDVSINREVRHINGSVAVLSSSSANKFVLVGLSTGLKILEGSTGIEKISIEGYAGKISLDGTYVASILDGTLILTSLLPESFGVQLCRLTTFSDGTWIVVSSTGLFDTNSVEKVRGLYWIMPDELLKPIPTEIFMRDYYEPRLLPRLLRGEKPPPIPSLAELNRNQPKIEEIKVLPHTGEADLVDVKVKVSSLAGQCLRETVKVPCESGVYDLRLYRDDQIVGQSPASGGEPDRVSGEASRAEFVRQWRAQAVVKTVGDQPVSVKNSPREVTFKNIRLPSRADVSQVKFTAYAFNEDRVKSATSEPVVYKLPEPRPANIQRRAYVVTVGVNLTDAPNWHLLFAPNGAREIGKLLKEQLKSNYEVVPIELISEPVAGGENRFQATKSNIQTVLDILARKEVSRERRNEIPGQDKLRPATPDDLVLVYIASHGYADPKGMFYIVPSDIGTEGEDVDEGLLNRCLTTNEQSEGCSAAKTFLANSISSEELSEWLQTIDAGEMTLILDSCHSASVSGPNFKPGPMGDRGFGQLSYDKGMRVLAATQTDKPAWGTLVLNDSSLLTYVLTRPEAIGKQFDMKFWLKEAERRVPEIYDREVPNERQQLQEPLLFDFVRK